MLDISNLQIDDLDKTLYHPQDRHLSDLKHRWYNDSQKSISHDDFVVKADAWFKATKINETSLSLQVGPGPDPGT